MIPWQMVGAPRPPCPRPGSPGCGRVNGKILAIGGSNGGGYQATVEEYDPVADAWSTKTPMSTARGFLAAAAVNGKIYAIGGINSANLLASVEEYDPTTNSWSTKASLSAARYGAAAASMYGKIYAIGGTAN